MVGQPQALLADAGYFSDENVKRCEAEGIEPYIASGESDTISRWQSDSSLSRRALRSPMVFRRWCIA